MDDKKVKTSKTITQNPLTQKPITASAPIDTTKPLSRDEVLKIIEEGLRIARYKIHEGRIKDIENEKCRQQWARVLASLATVYLNGLETKELEELAKRVTDIENEQIKKYVGELGKQNSADLEQLKKDSEKQDVVLEQLKKQAAEVKTVADEPTKQVDDGSEQTKKKKRGDEPTDTAKSYA